MTETIKELETAGEHGKCIILFADDKGTPRAVDTVYDTKTGLVSLLVSRGHGKNTFTEEYTANQTNLAIITPGSGKKVDVVGVLAVTDSETGAISLDFVPSGKKIMRLYASKFSSVVNDDMHTEGYPGEVVTLNTTTGANNVFILVNYRILTAVAADYNYLTVADFQTNPATGTATNPENINDNEPDATYAWFTVADQYTVIEFDKVYEVNRYRYIGSGVHNLSGRWKIEYKRITDGAWVTIASDIPTRDHTWSDWTALTTFSTTAIRITATTLDTGEDANRGYEWEFKYV